MIIRARRADLDSDVDPRFEIRRPMLELLEHSDVSRW
jgi:hypothetical protein